MTRYTSADVLRKLDIINEWLTANGREPMRIQSTNPDDRGRRYEFAGWVYMGAGEACRALDAMIWLMQAVKLTGPQRRYVARAIDVARGDDLAARILPPDERDELLRLFGGRNDS